VDLGADVIVVQGTESGGHGARCGRSTLPFVPIVVDLAAPTPVLAAGGIADGRGVAAALALGAAGALLGTRFQATAEALVDPSISKAIIEGRGEDTERSTVLDIARGSRWPSKYPGRTLGHPFLDQWRGREDELAADADAQREYQDGVVRGELPALPVRPARPSISSTTCRPRLTLSAFLPRRPRTRSPAREHNPPVSGTAAWTRRQTPGQLR
jgi:nitronate monooxygenase